MQVAICATPDLFSGKGLLLFLVAKLKSYPQLISNEVSDCILNIQWICSQVFELRDLQLLGSTKFFTPYRSFPLITLLLGILYCFFFQGRKGHGFLDICAKFLVQCYLFKSFLFNFGPSLGLSCLILPMLINILIIGISKTMYFDNTILMAELAGKLPQSRCSLSAHNFSNSGYFHKIFAMHLKKGSGYFDTKTFLPPLLYFWIYNPFPNGQIVSLITAQVHLQMQLIRAEWYRILKILLYRISPTK